ncbi:hypothetical protein AO703_04350 [[Enterobacter] lignolyticus]|uniref:Uncharacterized protein n=1 Tax=[Enterobacter] lignolyticus TaxID=1334193 RepID=A0A806XAB8_9ENTR|nr:hypothetical protein AO703_04350 [[Enterobacter] lignolyticus]
MGCLLIPVPLHDVEQLPHSIFSERFSAMNDGAAGSERLTGPVSDIHQIHDLSYGAIQKIDMPTTSQTVMAYWMAYRKIQKRKRPC